MPFSYDNEIELFQFIASEMEKEGLDLNSYLKTVMYLAPLSVLKESCVLYGLRARSILSMSANTLLEDLDIKPYIITKLKMVGIQSIFDLAISISHQLVDTNNDMLTRANEQVALELVTKAKKALVDSGLLFKDFSTAEQILERLMLTVGLLATLNSQQVFAKGGPGNGTRSPGIDV
jgi:hypothetical protein